MNKTDEKVESVTLALLERSRTLSILKGYDMRPIEEADIVFFRELARTAIEVMRKPGSDTPGRTMMARTDTTNLTPS